MKLERWYLERWDIEKETGVLAGGVVFGHNRIEDGTFVHTGKVLNIDLDSENKRLVVKTFSEESLYYLAFEDMSLESISYENTEASLKSLNISTDFMKDVETLAKAKQDRILAEVDAITADGDLLLKVADINVTEAYFKQGDKVLPINIFYHASMTRDSVLILEPNVVDFRYFPNWFSMSTYHISDSVKRLVIKNIGREKVTLDDKVYEAGSLTYVCTTDYSYSEGLFPCC